MTRDEVLDAVERERARLLDLIDGLGRDAERRAVTEGGWTAKDVLAHCVIWVRYLASAMGLPADLPRWWQDDLNADDVNERFVAAYRMKRIEDVRAELDTVVAQVVAALRSKSDDELNARDAKGTPLWKRVAGETFDHWPEHSLDLERALTWTT